MAERNIKVGNIKDVSGEVTIAGGDIYKGYTAEQVSILLTQITSTFQPKPFDGRCPYKGLDVFEEEDADLFFGRERLVEDLLGRVKQSRTVFVTGPSGSGKSSLVRAGLIHGLKQGAIQELHSERWLYETMKPGREPIKELSLAFSRLKSPELANYFRAHAQESNVLNECAESVLSAHKDQRFLLFVDQFEEVFTQINQEEERLAFLNMLAHAGTMENGRVIVLFAMRSDFVSNCATYPMLNDLLSQQFRQIGAMQPEELVSAIALPARHVGLPIEDELIARIINDMKGEPGALPLMQFALKDLFDSQQKQGGLIALRLEDYLRLGGIHKSLERHADQSFSRLSEGEQQLARSIFSGLIEIGRGTQDTRRTALFDELVPANARPQDVEVIVQKLADARLIITDEQAGKDTVTISHEKLIDAWPWLKKLVNENRDVIALQNEIVSDAKEWHDHQRDPSYLYSGARLINAREQLAAKKLVLSGLAQEFVQAGYARQRRGQVFLIGGLSTVIALLAIAVLVFSRQSRENRILAEQSHMRELAARSTALRERNLAASLLLGIEVFKNEDNPETRGLLLDNLQFNPQLLQFLRGHTDAVTSLAFSPDGKTLASGSSDNSIILWDRDTNQPIGEALTGHTQAIRSLAFSPDGTILASASDDQTVILWDVGTHESIGQPLTGHSGVVTSVAFSPDGSILATGGEDATIILWDMTTHEQIGQPLKAQEDVILAVAFSPDGMVLASGTSGKSIILWDMSTHQPIGQPLTGHLGPVYSVAFSPDGKWLASGGEDNAVILWDMGTHQAKGQPLRLHSSRVSSVAFSPDGKILASGSYDQTVILWDVASLQRIGQSLKGHSDWVSSVAFSPDGKMLASGGADRTVILWDVGTGNRIDRPLRPNAGSANAVAFSPDGNTLVSGHYNQSLIFWDVHTHKQIGQPLTGHSHAVRSVAFSPDGSIVASGSDDTTIILWDAATHEPIGQPLIGHSGSVTSLAFSPDGSRLVSGGADGTIIVWDIATHQATSQLLAKNAGSVNGVAFSPDGKIIASASANAQVTLWDAVKLQPIGNLRTGSAGAVKNVAFSPDGKLLASDNGDKSIILWDVASQEPTGQSLAGHTKPIAGIAFSADGKTLVSGSYDKTIILWDVSTREPIGQPLTGHTGSIYSIALAPNGKTLASGSVDNSILLWDLDPQSWIEKSCQRAGRNFTGAEWASYFRGEEYRKTCEQWPLE